METAVHCFEKSGLGKAPFRCVGFASIPSASMAEHNVSAYNNAMAMLPRDVGCGTCDYCGTAIMHNFIIQGSGEGDRRFVVGSDCVARTGDAGLIKAVRGERLKVVQEKRATLRRMKADERQAIWKRQREEQAAAFRVHNVDLIKSAEPWMHIEFIASVINRGLEGGYVSDKAYLAVLKCIADMVERDRLQAASQHVGRVGERLSRKVKVQRVRHFDRPAYAAEWRSETVWVVTMLDGDNVLVSKSTSFAPKEGAELSIKATVKAHDEYKGTKQTVVQRVKECA